MRARAPSLSAEGIYVTVYAEIAINNEIRRRVYTLPYNGEVAFFASKAAIMTLKYSHLLFSFEIHTR